MGMQFGVGVTEWSWGSTWIDYDNDGFQDLYVTTALVGNSIFPEVSSVFYKSNQAQFFTDYTSNVFVGNHIAASYAVAKGDINHDGYADMIVQNAKNYEYFLWQNSGSSNRYITISLKGTISNKMAIGSWIHVYAGGAHYTQYTLCGENYMSQSSQHKIFGLAQQSIVDSVVVEYLSGVIDKYYNLNVNEHYYFVEGETAINHISFSGNLSFCAGDSVVLDAGNFQSFIWSNGGQQQQLTVTQSGSYTVQATASNGLVYVSDTINVFVSPIPQISIVANHISCHNSNDGVLYLDILNIANNAAVTWNNGGIGDSLFNLILGTYTYIYTNSLGCTFSDSIELIEPYPLNVQTFIEPCFGDFEGMILLNINGGTPPYSSFLNRAACGFLVDSLMHGSYMLEIYDANDCYAQLTLIVPDSTNTGLGEISSSIKVFPNPFTGNIMQIKSDYKINQIEAFDSKGSSILTSCYNDQLFFKSDVFGMIYLRILIDKKRYWISVLKM
jgi:hypothetical protein